MNTCVTNKNCYDTLELAEEALIQNHIRNHHFQRKGPVNVYECSDCGNFHFTSKGEVNQKLQNDQIQDSIKKERQSDYWERKLR